MNPRPRCGGLGLHRLGVGFVVVEQALLEAPQLEEVVLLGDPLDRRVVDGQMPLTSSSSV